MPAKASPPISSLIVLALIVALAVALSKTTLILASGSATVYNAVPQGEPIKDYVMPILSAAVGALCVAGISRARKSP